VKPYPVRLPESLIDELEEEADEQGLGTAEHIRQVLRDRHSTQEHTQELTPSTQEHTQELTPSTQELTQANTQRIETLDERLAELEARVNELEAEEETHADDSDSAEGADDESPTAEQESLTTRTAAFQDTPDAGGSVDDPYSVVRERDQRRAEAEEFVEGLTLHGRWDDYDRPRKAALLWAWTYLRAQDADGREIATAVADKFGYDLFQYDPYEGDDRYPAYSLWNGFLSEHLRNLPGVEPDLSKGGGEWSYVEG